MSENGSEEKNSPEKPEEQEITQEAEAAAKVEAEVEAKEEARAPQHPAPKKGLMERRKSFAQSSVPNAHRGYNAKTPVVMLRIILILFLASFILAKLSS